MKPETTPPLGSKGARLLAFLVGKITGGWIKPGDPRTFIPYSEALRGLGIPARGRAGQQLKREGLDELNIWTTQNPDLPKIAGLIADKQTHRPNESFARSHGHDTGDWETWWFAETAQAIDFNWSRFLAPPALDSEPAARVREDESETPDYRKIITIEPGKRGGRPCIRGMRITVGDILGWLSVGMSEAAIIDDFPELTAADIHAALAFAADREKHAVSLVAMHR
jgi:uncharacterized protein (DUF433 family)